MASDYGKKGLPAKARKVDRAKLADYAAGRSKKAAAAADYVSKSRKPKASKGAAKRHSKKKP